MSTNQSFNNISANSISGLVVAANTVAKNGTSTTQVITPGSLSYVLQNPPNIGGASAGDGKFVNLTATTIGGTVVASSTTAKQGVDFTKVITPLTLGDTLKAPPVIGSNIANDAKFLEITATKLNLTGDVIEQSEGGLGYSSYQSGDILVGDINNKLVPLPIGSEGQVLKVDLSKDVPVSWTTIGDGNVEYASLNEVETGSVNNKAVAPDTLMGLMHSPPEIGKTQSNNAYFQEIAAKSITGSVVSNDTDIIDKLSDSKILTPHNLKTAFSYPSPIGDMAKSSGNFTDLSCDTITVTNVPAWAGKMTMATTGDDFSTNNTTKVISPAVLKEYLGNTDVSIVAPNATFTNISVTNKPWLPPASDSEAVAKLTNQKGITPSNLGAVFANPGPLGTDLTKNSGTFTVIKSDMLSGGCVATTTDIVSKTGNKVLTTSNITDLMNNPGPIGGSSKNVGIFTNISAERISGDVIATDNDVKTALSDDKVVTPLKLKNNMTNYGFTVPKSANLNSLTLKSISGEVVANSLDVENGTSGKLVSSDTLKTVLSSPPIPLGSGVPNDASFKNATIKSMNGDVVAKSDGISSGLSNNTVITPLGLKEHLSQPNPIGLNQANSGAFTDLSAKTIHGEVLAQSSDVTSIDKLTTPKYVHDVISSMNVNFLAPGPIGTSQSNVAVFTSVTADSIHTPSAVMTEMLGTLGNDQNKNDAYVNRLVGNSVEGNVIATTLSDTDNKTIVTPKLLSEVLTNPSIDIGNGHRDMNARNLQASSVSGLVVADDAKVKEGVSDSTIITPLKLKQHLANANPIGSQEQSTGAFTEVSARTIVGQVIASENELNSSVGNKVVTPATLIKYFEKPTSIGNGTSDANFAKVTASGNLYGKLGDSNIKDDAYVKQINASTVTGDIVAPALSLSNNTIVTPKLLSNVMASPPDIGLTESKKGKFTDLTANTLNGTVVATNSDVISQAPSDKKVVTPATLQAYVQNPSVPVGTKTTTLGNFASIDAVEITGSIGTNTQNKAKFTEVTAKSVKGDVIATVDDVKSSNPVSDKVITPSVLKDYVSTATANFTSNPTFTTVSGPVIANQTDLTAVNPVDNKLVTPLGVSTYVKNTLNNPPDIGNGTRDGRFKAVTATNLYGEIGANGNQTKGTFTDVKTNNAEINVLNVGHLTGSVFAQSGDIVSTDKIVTPALLNAVVSNPPEIISSQKATFAQVNTSTVNATKVIAQIGDAGVATKGYFSDLQADNLRGNVQATLTETVSETPSTSKVISPDTMQKALKQGGLSANLKDVTLQNQLAVTSGGTGINSVSKGDMLISSNANTLSVLPISTNDSILTVKNGIPSWQEPIVKDAMNPHTSSLTLDKTSGTSLTVQSTDDEAIIVAGGMKLAKPLQPSSGGLGYNQYDKGDMVIANSTGGLKKLALGTSGQLLTVDPVTNDIAWKTLKSLDLDDLSTDTLNVNNDADFHATTTFNGKTIFTNADLDSINVLGGIIVKDTVKVESLIDTPMINAPSMHTNKIGTATSGNLITTGIEFNALQKGLKYVLLNQYHNEDVNTFNNGQELLDLSLTNTLNILTNPAYVASSPVPDNFAVCWKGFYISTYAGEHTFKLVHKDGTYMWFDNVKVIETPSEHSAITKTFTRVLEKNRGYAFSLICGNVSGMPSCELTITQGTGYFSTNYFDEHVALSWSNNGIIVPDKVVTPWIETSNVVMSELSGPVIATKSEVTDGILETKVITPFTLKEHLGAPNRIGFDGPNDGRFSMLDVDSYTGTGVVSSKDDITNGVVGKIVTANALNDYMKSPDILGQHNPNDARIKTVEAENITGAIIASQDDIKAGSETKVVTSKALKDFIASPLDFGSQNPSKGKFTNLDATVVINAPAVTSNIMTTNSISGNAQAKPEDLVATTLPLNKFVSPSVMMNYLQAPVKGIGLINPGDGKFVTVNANNLYSVVGSASNRKNAFTSVMDTQKITGDCIAQASDVHTGTSNSTVITPATLKQFLTAPTDIGMNAAGKGKFSELTVNSINSNSNVFATAAQMYDGQSDNLLVTPLAMKEYMASPNDIGQTQAAKGRFSNIVGTNSLSVPTANIPNVESQYVKSNQIETNAIISADAAMTNITAKHLTGDVIATSSDIVSTTPANDKVVTPQSLHAYFNSPMVDFGSTNSRVNTFNNDINFNSVSGNVLATTINDATNKLVTPNTISTYLDAPTKGFGVSAPVPKSKFKEVETEMITGAAIASEEDVVALSTTKLLTPHLMDQYIKSPGPIGETNPSNGFFQNVKATNVIANIGSTANRNAATVSTLDAIEVKSENLKVSGTFTYSGILPVSMGGLGFNNFTTGDLMIASSTSSLSKLRIGNNNQVLCVNNGAVKWGTVYPPNYLQTGSPSYVNANQYMIKDTMCRNKANNDNITIPGPTTLDINIIGLNGIAQSNNLNGTISITGKIVAGTSTNFSSDFIVGDAISIDAGKSAIITAISSNTSLTLDSTVGDVSNVSYKRGGKAANMHYYIYALGHSTNPGYILSSRSINNGDVLTDLPSGYTTSNLRQLPYVLTTDTEKNLFVLNYSGNHCIIIYPQPINGNYQYGTFTQIDLGKYIPKIANATDIQLKLYNGTATSNWVNLSLNSSGAQSAKYLTTTVGGQFYTNLTYPVNKGQFYLSLGTIASGSTCNIIVNGYWIENM